jgi:hypothetical protein
MKNFNTWAASFFSWGETPSKIELEGYELAYDAGRKHIKQEIIKILKENVVYSREEGDIIYPDALEKIEKL